MAHRITIYWQKNYYNDYPPTPKARTTMKRSTKKSRRHRNPNISDEKSGPFFSKNLDDNPSSKVQQPFFPTKLQISQPNDKYEREADAVAERVTSGNPNLNGKKNSEKISKVQPGSLKSAQMKVQRKAEL